jgi:hypothetical protein
MPPILPEDHAMTSKLQVTAIKIYHPPGAKPRTDAEDSSVCPVEYVEGGYPGPVLKDLDIESDPVRRGLNADEANICISVQPGDEKIGQLHVCVQHEGKKGLTDECMRGQNDLARHLGDWLNELFADSPERWTFEIHAEPCPKAKEPLRVQELAARVEGRRALVRGQEAKTQPTREQNRESDR